MPKRTDLKSILIVGSGPIVIGQACEFDYSGTQACKVLRELGYRVILINSNPATIMTDPEFADATYIEPITPFFVERIIERERPDALLPTMGGQTALNVAAALAESGVLAKDGVELIGAKFDAIRKAEDRELFQKAMRNAGLKTPRGGFVTTVEEALKIVVGVGFPTIIRPSFTLGGTGGGTAFNIDELRSVVEHGLDASPIHEVLVEESVIGWKEYELEVMRDLADNVVVICSIENVDPMGVHTGDSITVAPAQTLADKDYQAMRDAAKRVIREIGVETGGSNIQFAIHPDTGEMLVIEMNPRVSRSSALASKATGFPIAKIAAMLSVGYTLDEIPNDITKETPASFEPTIDYVVVKIPRWDFEKFKGVDDTLGVQMKSVGEAMAFGRTFKEALQKGLRSLEIGRYGLGGDGQDSFDLDGLTEAGREEWKERIRKRLTVPKPDNIFYLRYALQLGLSVEELAEVTRIDPWFLNNIKEIVDLEDELKSMTPHRVSTSLSTHRPKAPLGRFVERDRAMTAERLRRAKVYGFSDRQLAHLWRTTEQRIRELRIGLGIVPVFKTVDTCAAEFEAHTPYHYSTYESENEVVPSDRQKVIILGSGPNRIGQGIEFDYCCVHGVFALEEEGYETIMINCNPETVSTDYDTTDKLYFEPLTLEDVLNVCEQERPSGVIVSFGGQTPLKLSKPLEANGWKILGTSPEGIDIAEDRRRFGEVLERLRIPHPEDAVATSVEEAKAIAAQLGFPVLVRPSYVLGGRAMEIVYSSEAVEEYMNQAVLVSPEHPVLIDRFLEDAMEFDVDAVCDGEEIFIGGVMEHIEEAGIHSGDSSCVLPPQLSSHDIIETIRDYTSKLAFALGVRGLINVQFAVQRGKVYVLEVNPRASRTVPFVSKATGVPLAKIAAKVMVGKKLRDLNIPKSDHPKCISIKESVFPFTKFPRSNIFLGPEMRSTGEVMGISETFGESIAKSFLSTGNPLPTEGGVFISVNNNDKNTRMISVARSLSTLGFTIYATEGSSRYLMQHGLENTRVYKVNEGRPNIVDHIKNGLIQLVINTPLGEMSRYDERAIGTSALEMKIPVITTISAAAAAVRGIESVKHGKLMVKSIQEYHRHSSERVMTDAS